MAGVSIVGAVGGAKVCVDGVQVAHAMGADLRIRPGEIPVLTLEIGAFPIDIGVENCKVKVVKLHVAEEVEREILAHLIEKYGAQKA